MESAPDSIEPLPGGMAAAAVAAPFALRGRISTWSWATAWERTRFAVLVYMGSRALLLAVAVLNGALRHHALTNELANWDGLWYRSVANLGYPDHVLHAQSNLGFFPLYPLVIRAVGYPVAWLTGFGAIRAITFAGVVVSMIGGLLATVLVQRLALGWWGQAGARRAVLLFCLFPGSVVFSMVYAEGLAIPLAAGCILALQRRRWLAAGLLAGLATAAEPEAVVLIPVCAVSALRHLRWMGWGDRRARASLLAPALSVSGLVGFAAYLWVHTGTPFATYIAQHSGWKERTDLMALPNLISDLAGQISFTHFNHPTINLNLPVGLGGAIVLIAGLGLLAWGAPRVTARPAPLGEGIGAMAARLAGRRRISLEAAVWTLGISFLALTSEYTPPNPRLLITAFPAVLVFADRIAGRKFAVLLAVNVALLVLLSALTFVGITVRP